MTKLRILIADDHAVLRDGLKALVNAQPDMEVVGEADNGKVACEKAKQLQPDVVLIDVSMPEMNGEQATRQLKRDLPGLKILALTAHEDQGYLRHLLEAGASGFLLKRAASGELIQAIHVVAANGSYIDPTLAGKVMRSMLNQRTVKLNGHHGEPSDREAEVLRLIAWGYSNKEIAARLKISVKTVETYKVRLSEKLQLASRTEMVRYAVRRGWLEDEQLG
jgi:DNA-binding NarL/FixJ family response regulator